MLECPLGECGIIFLIFTIVTLAISGVTTFVNQKQIYQEQQEEKLQDIAGYLGTVLQADGDDFSIYQEYFMAHHDKMDVPVDFDDEDALEARNRYETLFSEQYPGKTLGQDITFAELSPQVQNAFAVYHHERYLLLFEKARDNFDLIYTYYIVPTEEPLVMCYILDAVRELREPSGETIDLGQMVEEIPALLEGRQIDVKESHGSFGWLLTRYEPVYDSAGQCAAYVGADISMIGVTEYNRNFAKWIAAISFAFLVTLAVIAVYSFIHIRVESDTAETDSESIPRIAEEISFIKDAPTGDIPNVQVDGPRLAASEGIPVRDGMTLTFHTMSLPTARLVWHCPYISVFSAADGKVNGAGFHEYLLLRLDGENSESNDHVENKVQVKQMESFEGWNVWKDENKRGLDCVVIIKRDGNVITILVALAGGVNVIEGDQVVTAYGEADGIVNTESLTVEEGLNGEIVLGSNGGGIYIVDDSGVRSINVEDGLPSDVVMRLKRDKKNNVVWIVCSSAIAYMTPDYKVTTIKKFPYTNNFDLYENSQGDMWVLSSNGIYVTPTEELLANGEIGTVYYSLANGLPCITTANSYSELTPEGDLYIAGSTGICKVNIEQTFEDVNDLKVVVPFVEVDGMTIYPDETGAFTIPHSTQKLTVPSFVFNYSLSDPQVSHQLEGFDRGSTTVNRSDMVPIDYTNLRGGTYHYVMQLKDAMGRGNKEVSVQITKEKAFYEEAWFYVVAGLAALLLLILIVRLYVRRKTQKLEKKHKETMAFVSGITEAFAKVIDMKDRYTNGHSSRVAKYTAMLARELGYDEETVEKYYRIALLHDVGKVGVPQEVLNKPGKLTDEEFEIIKSHTTQGYNALKEITIMPELAIGAQAHHERPDGKGYPNHLKGDEIPRVAQIIAVADCFDAMYSNRPYRNRMNFDKVISIIKEVSGTQLTPDVVDAFLRLVDKGEFRDPDDNGGGSTENIENIRK